MRIENENQSRLMYDEMSEMNELFILKISILSLDNCFDSFSRLNLRCVLHARNDDGGKN
jgi:hypothetical protein